MSEDASTIPNARAVWDFTTGDERRFRDRLELVIDAAREFREGDVQCDFVLLLHGAATQFAARTLAGTKFTANPAEGGNPADLASAHELMRRFCQAGGRIKVCGIAMERCAIAHDNLIAGVEVERNVFVTAVALQNQGYAYMPVS
jgi:intracellular sulfur oxidation DsrE/DsrF family protein